MSGPKPIYAPVPVRAMGDGQLSAVDLRVLMAIAAHDRLKANGTGCYASHSRLAALAGCHLKSLSRSLTHLAQRGYVTARDNPLNKRTRIYHVEYTADDPAYLKSGGVAKGSEIAADEGGMGNKPVPRSRSIGNQFGKKDELSQRDSAANIFCEAGIHPVETVETYPLERTSLRSGARERSSSVSVGAMLAMAERAIKANASEDQLQHHHRYLDALVNDGEISDDDPYYHWAERLYLELGDRLDGA